MTARPIAAVRPFGELVRRAQSASPDCLAEVVAEALALFGARDVVLALVDFEQAALHPLLGTEARDSADVGEPVTGTMAGRCFTSQQLVEADCPGGKRLWIPVTERDDRIGVLSLTLSAVNDNVRRFCVELGLQVAQHVAAAGRYTDAYHNARRQHGMDLSAELQWNLLPPLSFASQHLRVAGLITPAYEVGGDAFDYAVKGTTVDFAILDAAGHGLSSSLLATLVIGAYRHCRRKAAGLVESAAAIDQVLAEQFGEEAFATALLGRLNGATGALTLLSAGHPAPLLLRDGHCLGDVPCDAAPPLGIGGDRGVSRAALEHGDRLVCYTDGVVDARDETGEQFGERRLQETVAREDGVSRSLFELARRTVTLVGEHRGASLEDDATLLFVERC